MKKITLFVFSIFCFLFSNSQNIVSITPDSAAAGEYVEISIVGHNTTFTQGSITNFEFEFAQNLNYNVITATNIPSDSVFTATVLIPPYTYSGYYDIQYSSLNDDTIIIQDAFKVLALTSPPEIISTELVSIGAFPGFYVKYNIFGQNTHFDHPSVTFDLETFDSQTGDPIDFYNPYLQCLGAELFKYSFSVHDTIQPGYYNIKITHDVDSILYLDSAIYISPKPEINSYNSQPNPAIVGEQLVVSIIGENTHFIGSFFHSFYLSGNNQLLSFYITNLSTTSSDTTSFGYFDIPYDLVPNKYDLMYHNQIDGFFTFENAIEIIRETPFIHSVFPPTVNAGDNSTITVLGDYTFFESADSIELKFSLNQDTIDLTVNLVYPMDEHTFVVNINIPEDIYAGMYDLHVYDNIDGNMILEEGIYINSELNSTENNCYNVFSISPNPVNDYLVLEINRSSFEGEIKADIYDQNGQIILTQNISSNKEKINTTKLRQGTYLIEIKDSKNSYIKKFIKL